MVLKLPGGKTASYLPVPAARAAHAARTPRVFDLAFSNLDYNGGPVMTSNTDYLLFWRPSTAAAYPSDYKSGLRTYFEALAHDSGGHQNVDSVAGQYNDAAGGFAGYDVKFGGELTDEDPYPASGCTRAPICLTDEQIQTEIAKFVTEHGLPTGLGVEYFLLTPEKVESCFEAGAAEVCSANSQEPFYCAYHLDIHLGGGGVILYANDPFVDEKNCDMPENHINGSSDSALFGGLSHEHLETVTDPEPNSAWTDYMTGEESGYEVADKCNSIDPEIEFGEPLGTVEVSGEQLPYNQEIDGQKYYIQREWSNQGHECMQRFTFSGTEPTAAFTAKVSTPHTDVALNAAASTAPGGVHDYSWNLNAGEEEGFTHLPLFGEFTGPNVLAEFPKADEYNVALTVFGADGTSIGAARVLKVGGLGPSASIGVAGSPTAGEAAAFSGAASNDPGGAVASYQWQFGDGSVAGGVSPSHTYAAPGAYTVKLLVTGSDGLNAEASRAVEVASAPEGGGSGGGGGAGGGGAGGGGGTGGSTGGGSTGGGSTGGSSSASALTAGVSRTETAATGAIALVGSAISIGRKGEGTVKLSCTGSAACTGKLTVVVQTKGKHRRKLTIGSASFSVPPGSVKAVVVKLTATGRARLKAGHGHLSASMTIEKSAPAPAAEQTRGVRLSQKQ